MKFFRGKENKTKAQAVHPFFGHWGTQRCSTGSGTLLFYKTDADTGAKIAGAIFTLSSNNELFASGTSNEEGAVFFYDLPPGEYTLAEASPPPGYQATACSYCVKVTESGDIYVDGGMSQNFRVGNRRKPPGKCGAFSLIKYDVFSSRRLKGAVFELRSGRHVAARAITDHLGEASFCKLEPGKYILLEAEPPCGYIALTKRHPVVIGEDGSATIDGFMTDQVSIGNEPELFNLSFNKIDSLTGFPLSGAGYELLLENTDIVKAVSNEEGRISFGIHPPGSYLLRELTPPEGYLPDTNVHSVVISTEGRVTVNGIPAEELILCNEPVRSR